MELKAKTALLMAVSKAHQRRRRPVHQAEINAHQGRFLEKNCRALRPLQFFFVFRRVVR